MIWAASTGNCELAYILLKHHACIDKKDTRFGFTPLMMAIKNNKLDMIELLLRHNANVNIVSKV